MLDSKARISAADLAAPVRTRRVGGSPDWARRNQSAGPRYTIGVEEEVMLVDRSDDSLAQSSEWVLAEMCDELSAHTSPETHASVAELATGVHANVADAAAELAALRARLDEHLRAMGLAAASAGTFSSACLAKARVSRSGRCRLVADSMRALAFREPTLALHVHVRVPDQEGTVRVLNGLRNAVPLLLALSAHSPICQSRDTGFDLAESRFLAARDGLNGRMIDPSKRRMVPARGLIDALVMRCRERADPVGVALDRISRLVAANGADLQRASAREDGIGAVVPKLTERFAAMDGRWWQAASPAPLHEGALR